MVRAKLTEKEKEKAKKEQTVRAEQSRAARRSGKSTKVEARLPNQLQKQRNLGHLRKLQL